MKKTTLIILIIILLGFIFSFTYWLVYKYTSKEEIKEEITEVLPLEESETLIIRNLTFSGEVKEITGQVLTIITDEETLNILINEETETTVVIPTEGEDGIVRPVGEGINFEDIKAGDKINILTKQENEKLIGIDALIFPTR